MTGRSDRFHRATSISCVLALAAVLATALPAGAAPEDLPKFALSGDARALELALGTQGLTLGVALARADSTPSAQGAAAGQCDFLGDEPSPEELPCNESTTASSSSPGDGGSTDDVCASPPVPDPLGSVLNIALACGSSISGIKGDLPFTANEGKVAELALELDLGGLAPQIEDVKEQVVEGLQGITNQAPEPVRTALNQLLDTIDAGQGARLLLGAARSDVAPSTAGIEVVSDAAGAKIGVLGIPDLDQEGVPIPDSADALEDGLIIIEVGAARASASLNLDRAKADGAADPALVRVKVRDITKLEPTYVEVEVAPGQTVTLLEGTPLESTITAAAGTTEVKGTRVAAAADAVRLHLLKGVQGGLALAVGRATAAASVEAVAAERLPRPPEVLPQTGARDLTWWAFGLLALALVLGVVRRRLN